MTKNITQLLQRWSDGDQSIADELFSLIYNELWIMARAFIRKERKDILLEPTVLVHEAYLRIANQENSIWPNRSHFYALAAKVMRHVLVDCARQRMTDKRGGEFERVSLSVVNLLKDEQPLDVIILDEALNQLAGKNSLYSRIFECRFFGGLSIQETADCLKVSHATVERGYTFSRAWLHRYMSN